MSSATAYEAGSKLAELLAWVADVCSGTVVSERLVAGGNRYRSWAVDVALKDGSRFPVYLRHQLPRPPSVEPYTLAREAEIYRAVTSRRENVIIRAPKLIAVHPDGHTVLSERVPGRAEFRRLKEPGHRVTVVQDFVRAIAALHKLGANDLHLDGLDGNTSIADAVAREIAVWRGMYEETHRSDPLIELALAWLDARLPRPSEPAVLVHGDAGPGNFLFEDGRMTALLDWELAHIGDPMEDIAWFTMRCVMEPVPELGLRLAEYEQLTGRAIDRARVLYHRVLVSTRIVILRHRNVTGEPGNSIVSRGLNRRLVVDALAAAEGVTMPPFVPVEAPDTERAAYYDGVLDDLRAKMAERSDDAVVVAVAKNAAKVLKYLRECDRLGPIVESADIAALSDALGAPPTSSRAGQVALVEGWRRGRIPTARVLAAFHGIVNRAAQLSAGSSGSIAGRTFPPLP